MKILGTDLNVSHKSSDLPPEYSSIARLYSLNNYATSELFSSKTCVLRLYIDY